MTVKGRTNQAVADLSRAELMSARYAHLSNARPLMGCFDPDGGALFWTLGGLDFSGLFPELATPPDSIDILLQALLSAPEHIAGIRAVAHDLTPGTAVSYSQRLPGHGDRAFMIRLHRGDRATSSDVPEVVFILADITAFVRQEDDTRQLANAILRALRQDEGAQRPAIEVLARLRDALPALSALSEDENIRDASAELAGDAERLIESARTALKDFDSLIASDDDADTSDIDLNRFTPMSGMGGSVSCPPAQDWQDIRNIVERYLRSEPDLPIRPACIDAADRTAELMQDILIIAPEANRIVVLNGPNGPRVYHTIEDLITALGVEPNSRRTATAFFESLSHGFGEATFAANRETIEARGRPTLGAGWQTTLSEASTQAIDIRGLLHGFKNLLLHLQVLHVIKTGADARAYGRLLIETVEKIAARLEQLRRIAESGPIRIRTHRELLGVWLEGPLQVSLHRPIRVTIDCPAHLRRLAFEAVPGEMEDTLAELARNPAQHGATEVTVHVSRPDAHIVIEIRDNGHGASPEKLAQIRAVLESGRYDPTLSTRPDGTGNGLLSAMRAISRFPDGTLTVDSPDGCGFVSRLAFLPPSEADT